MKEILRSLVLGEDLSREEAEEAMRKIMSGGATPSQISAFLVALRMKGETIDEITAFARIMKDLCTKINAPKNSIDTCGSGGDGLNTFNISTTAAFVVAGAGVPVAKHGNKSVSSKTGSADLLQELGVKIDLGARGVERCIRRAGMGFMYAPLFHPAMKHVVVPRREIGIRTVFNVLGPLVSPADVKKQIYGIFDPTLTEKLAGVLHELGSEHALVIHGSPGMDEISTVGQTKISELSDGRIRTYTISPEEFGLKRARLEDMHGGTAEINAAITRSILSGKKGPARDVVLLNAAAGIYVGGKAESIREALSIAEESIDSGSAEEVLNKLIEVSNA